jgi:hypothetical protein
MKLLSVSGEVLPILGTLGLLGLWLYQQIDVEARSDELRNLTAAYSVYQTYQSHNAVFNAMIETAGEDEAKTAKIRRFQMYNYELGLHAIDTALPDAQKADVPAPVAAYDSTEDVSAKMDRLQKRLTVLQARIFAAQDSVRTAAAAAKRRATWFYVLLSLITIAGAVCKVIDKFGSAAA